MRTNRSGHILPLKKRCLKLQALISNLERKLEKIQRARLWLGFLFILVVLQFYLKLSPDFALVFGIGILVCFAYLVFLTKKTRAFHESLIRLESFYQRQLQRCQGLPAQRKEYYFLDEKRDNHIVHDLNILGAHSLWNLLDETFSERGSRLLLDWILDSPPSISEVVSRQKFIHHLRDLKSFYTRLCVRMNSNLESMNLNRLDFFLEKKMLGKNFSKILITGLSLWVTSIVLILLHNQIGLTLPIALVFAFPMLSLFSLGLTSHIFSQAVDLTIQLERFSEVIKAIEERSNNHLTLAKLCPSIASVKISSEVKRFNFVLGFLGTQTNPLLHILINFFLPWTMTFAFLLERSRKKLAVVLPNCFAEVSRFEIFGSLIIFDYYQTRSYPHFSQHSKLSGQGIYHPLIPTAKAVENDFCFAPNKCLGLLTGSNMSGKSTFLRTLGVNQVLANMGAPVFADNFETCPFRVLTCIEISDSLRDGFSYFYAEVRRLKEIVTAIEVETPALYLIDEIFRGTNNLERQIGSRGILLALSKSKFAQGFISTHDLELTLLEKINPGQQNFHFRDTIDSSGSMIFTYQLQAGPCPTTNALRIMKAEGLPVDELGSSGEA